MTSKFLTLGLLIVGLLGFNVAHAATGYTATGWGTGYDGEYCDSGSTWNTFPTYTNGTKFLFDGGAPADPHFYTMLGDSANDLGTQGYYVSTSATAPHDPVLDLGGSWNNTGGGAIGTWSTTSGCSEPVAPTSTVTAIGFWYDVATSSGALVASTVPFWEVALGLLMAFMFIFLLTIGMSRPTKWLFRKNWF